MQRRIRSELARIEQDQRELARTVSDKETEGCGAYADPTKKRETRGCGVTRSLKK